MESVRLAFEEQAYSKTPWGKIFFKLVFYLLIFGCARSLLLLTGFLWLRRAGATLHCGAQSSHYGGFYCCGAGALGI